jgi:hypothetical protein
MFDISVIGLLLAGLFSGYLLAGLLAASTLQKVLGTDSLLNQVLPGYLRTAVILGIIAGLMNALAAQSTSAFLLAIIAMSLILSRTHILRMVLTHRTEGRNGDAGALRVYRLSLFLFAGLFVAQLAASVIAVYLLAVS